MTPAMFPIDRRHARWLFGGAGGGLLLAQAAIPALPESATARTAVIAANRAAVTLSAAAFLTAGILLVIGCLAANTMPLVHARRWVTAGTVLTAIGALWPVAGRATYNLVMVALAGHTDTVAAAAAARAIDQSGSFAILLVTLAAFALGPVILTFGLWRAGIAPIWPAILWIAGVLVVNGTSNSSRAAATLGMLLATAALAWLGTRLAATPTVEPAIANPTAQSSPTST